MKKNKSKLKSQSADKKKKKELELSLAEKIREAIAQLGKVKKGDKAIERFSKKIIKKLALKTEKDFTPVVEEKTAPVKTPAKAAKPAVVKKPKTEAETK
ncbi:hypothetical protein [Pedobacter paludis]|uniref:Uncharacterized protein n=1 Tax=Pedobacter paludis TaxID=2203212 RepID=A0A317EYJ4_9SPHI|nr:hypothetical protein [Pedobacter paludis]PWS31492.1 hypothetical protein DF947_12935 [Pedobacter paludis]